MTHSSPGPRVLVVGGSPLTPAPHLVRTEAARADFVCAVDSGGEACLAAGVAVDRIVGDLDSIAGDALSALRAAGTVVEEHPSEKDVTDLHLALSYVRTLAPRSVRVVGVVGGTPDHQLAVWGDLVDARDLAPVAQTEGLEAHVLSPDGRARHEVEEGRRISVVGLTDDATVTLAGMKWNLAEQRLGALSGRGVSNVAVGPSPSVEVSAGTVVLFVYDVATGR